jgi:predicted dehydrogenase
MYSAQMAEFVDAVLEGRPPQPDGHQGAVVMSVLEQAYRAAGVAR